MNSKQKAAGGSAIILAMISATMILEGGYVNHPKDPGGETNMGITKKVAVQNGYTGPMKKLPEEIAISIYYKDYIVKPGFAPLVPINAPVVAELYDTATNMGPAKPSKWLQQSINELCGTKLVIDGKVGEGTRGSFTTCQAKLGATRLCLSMLDSLDTKQRAEYDRLVRVNPSTYKVFYKGWVNHRIGNIPRSHCSVRIAA